MMTDRFLSAVDARRASKTLQKLSRHDIRNWALAGGFAVEIHCLMAGVPGSTRPLNDIDFVAAGFDCAPTTLERDFLFRHVHPLDPPGKTMLQLVDAETALRVDLFRAYGSIMARTRPRELPFGALPVISCEDVLARAARLLLDLGAGVPVAAKHAGDYVRLARLPQTADVEIAWQDHRRADHPVHFREADMIVRDLIASRGELLITPDYSKDVDQVCGRCLAAPGFPLADPDRVLSILGYC